MVETSIRKLLHLEENNDATIHFRQIKPDEETNNIAYALIKFNNENQAVQYFHKNKDLKLLIPRQIAALVLSNTKKNQSP